jgi:phosphatidylglycerol:prolipoprotein diacylglycerol transferase
LKYRIKRGEFELKKISNINYQISQPKADPPMAENKFQISNFKFQQEFLLNLLIHIFIGLLIGARLGYVLFYDFQYFLEKPLAIVSPFDSSGNFVGIYGMSYHGGLLGALLFGWVYCRRNKINFFKMADFVTPAIPAGYFLGRIGNFLNGELYGRVTERPWGMYFPSDHLGVLRHPSQLYEAFFEGIILFLIVWYFRNTLARGGQLLGLYIAGYSIFRIFCEFFREPDTQIGYIFNFLTLGQVLSLPLLVLGIFLLMKNRKICYNVGVQMGEKI